MGDETIAANKFHEKIAFAGELHNLNQWTEDFSTDGADQFAGAVVTTDNATSGDLDLIAAGENAFGIVLDFSSQSDYPEDYDVGDTFADNSVVDVLKIRQSNGRIKAQVVLSRSKSTAVAYARGSPLYAEAATGKVIPTAPTGAPTQKKMYVGTLADAVASGTGDKIVGAWV